MSRRFNQSTNCFDILTLKQKLLFVKKLNQHFKNKMYVISLDTIHSIEDLIIIKVISWKRIQVASEYYP